jgi:hypothetical protein
MGRWTDRYPDSYWSWSSYKKCIAPETGDVGVWALIHKAYDIIFLLLNSFIYIVPTSREEQIIAGLILEIQIEGPNPSMIRPP